MLNSNVGIQTTHFQAERTRFKPILDGRRFDFSFLLSHFQVTFTHLRTPQLISKNIMSSLSIPITIHNLGPQLPPNITLPPFLGYHNVATTLSPVNRWRPTASVVEIPTLNWGPTTSVTVTGPMSATTTVGTVETQRVRRGERGRVGYFDEVVLAEAERAVRLVGNEAFVNVRVEPREAVEVDQREVEGKDDASDMAMVGVQEWKSFDARAAAALLGPGPVVASGEQVVDVENVSKETMVDEEGDGDVYEGTSADV